MAKGYWVVAYRAIHDPAKLAAYAPLATEAAEAVGARYLVRGGQVTAHESGLAERTTVVEFPSYEAALAAHESEIYQKALVALGNGVDRDFRIVEGT